MGRKGGGEGKKGKTQNPVVRLNLGEIERPAAAENWRCRSTEEKKRKNCETLPRKKWGNWEAAD